MFLSSSIISLRNPTNFKHQSMWQLHNNIFKNKKAEFAEINLSFYIHFLSLVISPNIHWYFSNIFHEFKILKKLLTFMINSSNFGLFCFFHFFFYRTWIDTHFTHIFFVTSLSTLKDSSENSFHKIYSPSDDLRSKLVKKASKI